MLQLLRWWISNEVNQLLKRKTLSQLDKKKKQVESRFVATTTLTTHFPISNRLAESTAVHSLVNQKVYSYNPGNKHSKVITGFKKKNQLLNATGSINPEFKCLTLKVQG